MTIGGEGKRDKQYQRQLNFGGSLLGHRSETEEHNKYEDVLILPAQRIFTTLRPWV